MTRQQWINEAEVWFGKMQEAGPGNPPGAHFARESAYLALAMADRVRDEAAPVSSEILRGEVSDLRFELGLAEDALREVRQERDRLASEFDQMTDALHEQGVKNAALTEERDAAEQEAHAALALHETARRERDDLANLADLLRQHVPPSVLISIGRAEPSA